MTLRLTKSEAASLDAHASAVGMKRSAAVRDAVMRVIAAEQRRAKKAAKPASTTPGAGMVGQGDDS